MIHPITDVPWHLVWWDIQYVWTSFCSSARTGYLRASQMLGTHADICWRQTWQSQETVLSH